LVFKAVTMLPDPLSSSKRVKLLKSIYSTSELAADYKFKSEGKESFDTRVGSALSVRIYLSEF
jgi:hypothetical protein